MSVLRLLSYVLLVLGLWLLAGCPHAPQQDAPPVSAAGLNAPAPAPATPPVAAADPAASPADATVPSASGASAGDNEVAADQVAVGHGKVRDLPANLPCASYSGQGAILEVFATKATARAGRGDPGEVSFTAVVQRSRTDFDIASWKSSLPKPVAQTVHPGPFKVVITPHTYPQRRGVNLPSGQVPLEHDGYYDLTLYDAKGKTLCRMGAGGEELINIAPQTKQPEGATATGIRERNGQATFYDLRPLAGGDPLLRVEASFWGPTDLLSVAAGDGDTHQFSYPHVLLRFLPPGTFTATDKLNDDAAEQRSAQ